MFRTRGFIFRRRLYIRYGIICLHANSISSLLGGRLLLALTCKQIIPYRMYKRLPEDEPSGSKHIDDMVKIKILV